MLEELQWEPGTSDTITSVLILVQLSVGGGKAEGQGGGEGGRHESHGSEGGGRHASEAVVSHASHASLTEHSRNMRA